MFERVVSLTVLRSDNGTLYGLQKVPAFYRMGPSPGVPSLSPMCSRQQMRDLPAMGGQPLGDRGKLDGRETSGTAPEATGSEGASVTFTWIGKCDRRRERKRKGT